MDADPKMRRSFPFFPITEAQIYVGALTLLLFIWFVMMAANLIFLVLAFLPDHAGFGDSLRALNVLQVLMRTK